MKILKITSLSFLIFGIASVTFFDIANPSAIQRVSFVSPPTVSAQAAPTAFQIAALQKARSEALMQAQLRIQTLIQERQDAIAKNKTLSLTGVVKKKSVAPSVPIATPVMPTVSPVVQTPVSLPNLTPVVLPTPVVVPLPPPMPTPVVLSPIVSLPSPMMIPNNNMMSRHRADTRSRAS